MTGRDLRILELRKLGLSYSWIGARVGVSKVRVGQVIRLLALEETLKAGRVS